MSKEVISPDMVKELKQIAEYINAAPLEIQSAHYYDGKHFWSKSWKLKCQTGLEFKIEVQGDKEVKNDSSTDN